MLENGLISIIIPVYGVERYIGQCLNSVCSQSYERIEVIVIDDESPDNSGKIADQYAEKDSRIRVEHIKNRGAAGARNVGLAMANGDYIAFVDSDDWLEPNYLETLISAINKTGSDIVQCQFYDEYVNNSLKHTFIGNSNILSDEEFIEDMLTRWEDILIWNKLFRRNVLADIRFVEGRCIDDEFYTYKVIMNSCKIAMITDYLYHYRSRRSSAMGNVHKMNQRRKDQIDFVTERYAILTEKYPLLQPKLLKHKIDVYLQIINFADKRTGIYKETRKLLCQSFIPMLASNCASPRFYAYVLRMIMFGPKKHKDIQYSDSEEYTYFD